jgi:hypothetical protein
MASLPQIENSYAIYLGWYGIFAENTDEFELKTWPEIHAVYKIDSLGAIGYLHNAPSFAQPFTKMKCGNGYAVVLKPGNINVDIPNFVEGNSAELNIVLEDSTGMINSKPNPESIITNVMNLSMTLPQMKIFRKFLSFLPEFCHKVTTQQNLLGPKILPS